MKVKNAKSLGKGISEAWNPSVLHRLNGQEVRLAMFEGNFPWHSHESEDELFVVVEGSIVIDIEEGNGETISYELGEWDSLLVPRGTRHRPRAEKPARVMLFEPAETVNTGELDSSDFTRSELGEL